MTSGTSRCLVRRDSGLFLCALRSLDDRIEYSVHLSQEFVLNMHPELKFIYLCPFFLTVPKNNSWSPIYSQDSHAHCREICKIAGKLTYILRWVNVVFYECQAVKVILKSMKIWECLAQSDFWCLFSQLQEGGNNVRLWEIQENPGILNTSTQCFW